MWLPWFHWAIICFPLCLNCRFMNVIDAQELRENHMVFDPIIVLNHNRAHCGLMWFTHIRYGIITRSSTLDAPTLNFRNTAISHMGKMVVAPLKLNPITCLFTSATSQPIISHGDMHERRGQWIRQAVIASSAISLWLIGVTALRWFGIHRPLHKFGSRNYNYANDYTE